jgi:hypothetical protein
MHHIDCVSVQDCDHLSSERESRRSYKEKKEDDKGKRRTELRVPFICRQLAHFNDVPQPFRKIKGLV